MLNRRKALLTIGGTFAIAGCTESNPEPDAEADRSDSPESDTEPQEVDTESDQEETEVEVEGPIFGDAILQHNKARNEVFLRDDGDDKTRSNINLTEVYNTVKNEYESRPEESIEDFGGFFDAANDVFHSVMHEIGDRDGGRGWSTFNGDGTRIADRIMEDVLGFTQGYLSGANNPGHGIGSGMSADGHYLFDTQFKDEAGRTGTDPINREDTDDRIHNVNPDWIDSEDFSEATDWQIAANQVFNWNSGNINSRSANYHRDLVEPVIEIYKEQNQSDWEMMLDKVVPASMAAAYISSNEIGEDEYLVVNPDNLEDLPSISDYMDSTEFELGSVFDSGFGEPETDEMLRSQREYMKDIKEHYNAVDEETWVNEAIHPN